MGNLFETDFVYIKSPSSDQYIDDDKKIISDDGFRNLHHQPSTASMRHPNGKICQLLNK